jgi:hypothetical protein
MANKVKKPLVNNTIHLINLLKDPDSLSEEWKDRLKHMLNKGYTKCSKLINGTYLFEKDKSFINVTANELMESF